MPADCPDEQDTSGVRRRVIIPVDQSEHSIRARQWYYNQIKQTGDMVIFVHIVEPTHPKTVINVAAESVPTLVGNVLRISEESINEGKRLCRECMQEAVEHGVKTRSSIYVDTKPGVALTRAIHELKGDFVLMGNRGQGKLRRTFLGSVSSYILHHVHIPVAIVPPKSHKHSVVPDDGQTPETV